MRAPTLATLAGVEHQLTKQSEGPVVGSFTFPAVFWGPKCTMGVHLPQKGGQSDARPMEDVSCLQVQGPIGLGHNFFAENTVRGVNKIGRKLKNNKIWDSWGVEGQTYGGKGRNIEVWSHVSKFVDHHPSQESYL